MTGSIAPVTAGGPRAVRITYLAAAARWEIAERGLAGTTVLGTYRPTPSAGDAAGIWIGTASDGRIVEVVIDAADPAGSLSEVARDLLRQVFGPAVAEAVAQIHPEGDVEITFEVSIGDVVVPGEPGIPSPTATPGQFLIPAALDDASYSAEPVIDMSVESGRLRLRLPGTVATPGLWVRISSASCGELMGLAAVRAADAVAEVTIDPQIPVTDLHVQITSSPLTPVGDSAQRRRIWAEQLLTGLETAEQIHTATDRERLQTAATLAEILDEPDLRERVLIVTARRDRHIRRSRLRRLGLFAALAGVGAIGLLVLAVLTGSGWGPFADEGIAPEATPGPMTADYSDGSRARVFIPDAPAEVRAGATIDLRVQATTIDLVGYGYDPATTPAGQEEAGSRAACRTMINREAGDSERQLTPTRFILRLAPLAANGAALPGGSVIITDGTVPPRAVTISSVREACDAVPYPADGAFFVPSVVERTPFTLSVTVPAELAPGLWQVHLDMPDAPVETTGAVILRVQRP